MIRVFYNYKVLLAGGKFWDGVIRNNFVTIMSTIYGFVKLSIV